MVKPLSRSQSRGGAQDLRPFDLDYTPRLVFGLQAMNAVVSGCKNPSTRKRPLGLVVRSRTPTSTPLLVLE